LTRIALLSSKQIIWIDKSHQLRELVDTLSQEPLLYVDTESDSLYSYFEKVCLIQFSTTGVDYLVDPLAVDVSVLAPIFAASSIQKVFHAAEYDLLSLKRDYGFSFANIFDTMLAARILGWPRYGLGPILEQYFGVKLDKRFQRYNWGKRPIIEEALNYARLDTHYLLSLRQIQLEELVEQRRLREAEEAFERETRVEPVPKVFDPEDFWRIKGSRELEPQQQAVLRELFMLRDRIARKIDRPPFKVINDAALLRLARVQPGDNRAMYQIKGIGENLLRHNASDILKAIERGQAAPYPRYPTHHNRLDEDTLTRYETLRQWRNDLAAERGVEPDVIIGNDKLLDIARRNPQSLGALTNMDILGDWQFETYGKSVINVLRQQGANNGDDGSNP
jgi:ribonuclease D